MNLMLFQGSLVLRNSGGGWGNGSEGGETSLIGKSTAMPFPAHTFPIARLSLFFQGLFSNKRACMHTYINLGQYFSFQYSWTIRSFLL